MLIKKKMPIKENVLNVVNDFDEMVLNLNKEDIKSVLQILNIKYKGVENEHI